MGKLSNSVILAKPVKVNPEKRIVAGTNKFSASIFLILVEIASVSHGHLDITH